jgi:uncharacterized protein (TIGR03437 family)
MTSILKLWHFVAVSAYLATAILPAHAQFSPAPLSPFFAGHNPVAIVSADFNNDKIPDLAVANQSDSTVVILLGDGHGNFTPATTGPTLNGVFQVGMNPSAMVTGDFNHDGKPDLAVANINGMAGVTILLGDGAGGFQSPSTFVPVNDPSAMVTGLFNSDKNLDLAVANLSEKSVTILFGDGNGGFSPSKVLLNAGLYPIAMVAADLNADGVIDLAVASEGDGKVRVFIGPVGMVADPTSTLTSAAIPSPPLPVTQTVSAIVAGNFTGHLPTGANGMPLLDLVVSYYDNSSFHGNLLLFTALGDNNYNSPPGTIPATPLGLQPIAMATGMFALNAASPTPPAPGVAIADYRSNSVAVYNGVGDPMGDLSASANSPYKTGSLPRAIAMADLNGDGLADIAVANYNDGTVTVLLNAFSTAPTMLSAASGTSPVAPGSLVSIYGTGLAYGPNPAAPQVNLTDGSGSVLPMTVLYASATQLNAQVPVAAAAGTGSFTVIAPPSSPQKAPVVIVSVAPALFSANGSGKGPAAAYIQSVVTEEAPIPVFTCSSPTVCLPYPFDVSTGSTSLVLYGTGIRNHAQLPVMVMVNGLPLSSFYAGPTPGIFGVDQVNVSLPSSLAHAGTVFVQVVIGAAMSNPVTIAIQ